MTCTGPVGTPRRIATPEVFAVAEPYCVGCCGVPAQTLAAFAGWPVGVSTVMRRSPPWATDAYDAAAIAHTVNRVRRARATGVERYACMSRAPERSISEEEVVWRCAFRRSSRRWVRRAC